MTLSRRSRPARSELMAAVPAPKTHHELSEPSSSPIRSSRDQWRSAVRIPSRAGIALLERADYWIDHVEVVGREPLAAASGVWYRVLLAAVGHTADQVAASGDVVLVTLGVVVVVDEVEGLLLQEAPTTASAPNTVTTKTRRIDMAPSCSRMPGSAGEVPTRMWFIATSTVEGKGGHRSDLKMPIMGS